MGNDLTMTLSNSAFVIFFADLNFYATVLDAANEAGLHLLAFLGHQVVMRHNYYPVIVWNASVTLAFKLSMVSLYLGISFTYLAIALKVSILNLMW